MIDIAKLREDKRPQSSTIVHALLDRLEAAERERDDLRAKIEAMGKQEPLDAGSDVFRGAFEAALKAGNWPATRQGDGYRSPSTQIAWRIAFSTVNRLKLYLSPGAQNIPEKLCYDSRWEISIDYVDGWNAAVDMMRGKSPSWHCPDCCIAFPFGAPKSCPNDDARCNSLLAAAPEASRAS